MCNSVDVLSVYSNRFSCPFFQLLIDMSPAVLALCVPITIGTLQCSDSPHTSYVYKGEWSNIKMPSMIMSLCRIYL